MAKRILVWDIPTRIFHWGLVFNFTGAFLTADSDYRVFHVMFGYTMLGLLSFRILWGICGSRYVRFCEFLCGPIRLCRYLKSLFTKHPEHYVGHNPAGALAIVMLISLGLSICVTGLMSYDGRVAGIPLGTVHNLLSYAMLGVVGVHVFGAVASSFLHRENLIGAMITGFKPGDQKNGIGHARAWVGIALAVSIIGFWAMAIPNNPFTVLIQEQKPGLDLASDDGNRDAVSRSGLVSTP